MFIIELERQIKNPYHKTKVSRDGRGWGLMGGLPYYIGYLIGKI